MSWDHLHLVASLGNRHILLDLRRLLIRHRIVILLIVAAIKVVAVFVRVLVLIRLIH